MQEDQNGFEPTLNQIEAQEKALPEYVSYLKALKIENVRPEEAVFCGAGDSFACAQFVERLMNFKPRAFDPYDVLLYPEIIRDKKVFFISVSGKTKSNILAAKLAKRRGAKETVAITADPESELAKSCTGTIELRFSKSAELTPGTLSFTTSLLACGMMFKNLPKLETKDSIQRAKSWAQELSDAPISKYHFVGSGSFFAIAIYGAAKMFEFSG
ncbi:MAG TPA: SIS domain-containing protein, partial [Nitrososphaerales archaeon]|nr:SIS domain-containing protein [Nitrososphaerales archaeon]